MNRDGYTILFRHDCPGCGRGSRFEGACMTCEANRCPRCNRWRGPNEARLGNCWGCPPPEPSTLAEPAVDDGLLGCPTCGATCESPDPCWDCGRPLF